MPPPAPPPPESMRKDTLPLTTNSTSAMVAKPRKLFGTDGVRGVANTELSPQLAMSLGAAAALVLGREAASEGTAAARARRRAGDLGCAGRRKARRSGARSIAEAESGGRSGGVAGRRPNCSGRTAV